MPRNEEGEYELVLGTPQLLSVIFILIVLLGVVFSAGYFLGRTAAGEAAPGLGEPGKQAGAPGDAPEQPAGTVARATASPPPQEAAAPLAPGEAKVATRAGTGEALPSTPPAASSTPTPAAPAAQQPSAAPSPAPPTAQEAAATGAESPAITEPEPGQTFVQVAAVRRNEAEFLADMLRRKGFPARIAPGPTETLFRVLVGPLKDQEEVARMRKRLEEAGFRSAYVRRY